MIYCCPQSEWFLLGAMEGELSPFEGRIAPLKGELPLFGRANCLSLEGRIAIRPYKCATTPLEGIFHGLLSSISLSVRLFSYMARPARIIRSLSLRSFLRRALKPFL